jgi:two-component system, NarL family, sensor kinase
MSTGIMILAAFVNIALLASFIILIIKLNKIIENNIQNHTNSLLLQEVQFEQAKLQAIIETQEDTFTNIANELHDNIGHKLTYLKLQMQQSNAGNIITNLINDVGICLDDIRDISRSLNGEHLLSNGFLACVQDLIERTEQMKKYTIKYTLIGEPFFLPKNVELILFRVIQEAFSNIHKHAQATEIYLQLQFEYTMFGLSIADNGIGFNPNNLSTKSQGLANIKTRVQLLKGNCHINSEQQQGTTITIQVPINNITNA